MIYNLFIRLYVLGIRIASLWNPKGKEWVGGRKNLFKELSAKITGGDKTIWFHCASAGEFEQGKPLIEEMKRVYPSHKIVVSFFSPSGYSAAKKYPYADIITYLPADTRKNAKHFIELIKPELVVFVKYEYWYHHLSAVAFHHIPLIMVSAIFRKEQLFFKKYGKFYRQMLFLFRQIFVQDKDSLDLLKAEDIQHCSLSGDTRFDRVKKIAGNFSEVPLLKEFIGESKTIVAGSTWEGDEEILSSYVKGSPAKIVIAPHEIKKDHILKLQQLFPGCVLYSELRSLFAHSEVEKNSIWNSINEQQEKDLQKKLADAKTLIIDSMGLLSKLYYYATVTYVGGGFKSGIHNTLEAVVYGKPVLFGPKYYKFKEARDLIEEGAAFSVTSTEELKTKMDHLLNDPYQLSKAGDAAKNYVEKNTGATQKILQFIQENRLLTN
ncbi:MAG TPA: glycosyltransferase N-terminal domain-containing protein [Flavisolibacter sp.]|nr:glycosyltransferase N-terminal domain-containing protein [Flavisolibacter sp.]